ncbi:hypothetical protein E2C01_102109 [Portunus trituberculatus]|uniref:Uncharacterized protein n=1 Tax=Portunus trituberculatus TaxID=210409 RepID=A0A5B7KHH9_PORTR|nr:hypothetical protein [Portunus trituberculatus]
MEFIIICPSLQPFERLEATLHRDITAELGLASSRNIFISLQQQGMARGVRVTETSPGHIVVSGSLMELLASRVSMLAFSLYHFFPLGQVPTRYLFVISGCNKK